MTTDQQRDAERLLPMVYRLAKKYARRYMRGDVESAVSLAQSELCRWVVKYPGRESVGVSLKTYCYKRIHRELGNQLLRDRRYVTSDRANGLLRRLRDNSIAEIKTGLSDDHDQIATDFWISRHTLVTIARGRGISRRAVIDRLRECKTALREILTCRTHSRRSSPD